MTAVLPVDVLAFLGQDGPGMSEEKIQSHIDVCTQMGWTHVRRVGFDLDGAPDDALAAVIVSSTARLVRNPTTTSFTAIDDAQVRQGTFHGWALPELAILHSYRARAR